MIQIQFSCYQTFVYFTLNTILIDNEIKLITCTIDIIYELALDRELEIKHCETHVQV
jgi:hypothetical protein